MDEKVEKQAEEQVDTVPSNVLPIPAPRTPTRSTTSDRGYGKGSGSKSVPSGIGGGRKKHRKNQQGKKNYK